MYFHQDSSSIKKTRLQLVISWATYKHPSSAVAIAENNVMHGDQQKQMISHVGLMFAMSELSANAFLTTIICINSKTTSYALKQGDGNSKKVQNSNHVKS